MTRDPDSGGARPVRADARRNREKILAAAWPLFAAADAGVSLERVAREAGVGIGTLYRHFPTREALIEAVYAAELDDLAASASTLLEQLAPEAALRAWTARYAAFVATKLGMLDTLRAGWAAGRGAPPTRERLTSALGVLLAEGARTGSLRADVEADDVLTLLHGAFLAAPGGPAGADRARTERLLALVLDAVRPR